MINSLKDYVEFLCKHNMSGDQFLFCCLIYERKFDLLYKIHNERAAFDRDELNDLEDRGYIINSNKSDDTYCDMYIVTDKFIDEIYKQEPLMWEEVINTYPHFMMIDGKRAPLQGGDLDTLKVIYLLKIIKSPSKHKKVMKCLHWAIEHDMIVMGLEKWVKGEQWRAIEQLMEEEPKETGRDEREF